MPKIVKGRRALGTWIVDQIIEHWPTIAVVSAGSVMAYLASITAWVLPYGPVALGAIGLLSALVLSIIFLLYGVARMKITAANYAAIKATTTSPNVLRPDHQHERLNLSDFYHPHYQRTRHVRFERCELMGPAFIATPQCIFTRCFFHSCQTVIVREDMPIVGAIGFEACHFIDTKLYQVTFIMQRLEWLQMPEEMRVLVPVISEEVTGATQEKSAA